VGVWIHPGAASAILPHLAASLAYLQILRSGTSIGANYRSKAEFIAKLGIVLEEADETVFWLELLLQARVFRRARSATC
jgi:four helix bundle protein